MSTDALAVELGVSRETVRRDLIELGQAGLLQRVHGGAVGVQALPEASYLERQRTHRDEKRAIARTAAGLVEAGQCCFIDAGSTTHALAQVLVRIERLTVITNSVDVATTLAVNPGIEVVLLGGRLAADVPATHGEQTVGEIRRYRADLALISPTAVHPEHGAMDYLWHEAAVAQAMAAQSARRVLLAHAPKLGVSSRTQVCATRAIDVLVTDARADAAVLAALRAAGVGEVRSALDLS